MPAYNIDPCSSAAGVVVSSGHKSSTFSQTCNLLSQYIKERRYSNIHCRYGAIATMNLFPQEAAGGSIFNGTSSSSAPYASQMTIFYRGQVIVIDDLSPDKAKQIMQLAAAEYHPGVTMNTRIQESDLPIAMKGSLQRFLKKIRKDRVSARAAPYSLSQKRDGGYQSSIEKHATSGIMGVSDESWLSLAPGNNFHWIN